MNRQILRTTFVMTGVATATVAASLLAIGCSGASGTSAPTAGGSSAVATTTTSQNLTGAAYAPGRPVARNGRWIAYATAPAGKSIGASTDLHHGSDVFMTRAGHPPTLVASRGSGHIWNICPAFSQDGKMLAFAELRPAVRRSSLSASDVTARSTHQGRF